MAQPTNTFDTYDAIGNREDLSNLIYNISPTDYPFMTMAGKDAANAVYTEWQTDSLAAASTSNAQTEGDDYSADASSPTVRVGNYCQISYKVATVSSTQEAVSKAGRKSEMGYQMAKRSKELKRDMESILVGNQAASAGSNTTAIRTLRSLEAWYSSNVSRGTNGASGSTTLAATDATTAGYRAFTEDLLKTVIRSCYTNGGNPDILMVGPFNRQRVSGFTGNASRTADAKTGKLMASVSVYESDFGDIKIVPNRFQRDRTAHLISSDMVSVAFLRPFSTVDIAKTGSNTKKAIEAEYTLKVHNEAAHGVIADLTTS